MAVDGSKRWEICMKCLNCEEQDTEDSVLCDTCSAELEADIEQFSLAASQESISANSLQISPDGIIWLIADNTVLYLKLDKQQWSVLTEFLMNKKWK